MYARLRGKCRGFLPHTDGLMSNIFIQQQNSLYQGHSLTFYLNADYTPTPYLVFNAGSSRDRMVSNTQTLSSLTAQESSITRLLTMYYGSATFNYMLTRSLQYRAELREEYRIDDFNHTETRTHRLTMNADYRIRMILIGLEYRYLEELPSNAPSVMQQQYVAKISRPF